MTTLAPSTVAHALNVPTFYQQKVQFWNMLGYLFAEHEQKPVWHYMNVTTCQQLAQQLQLAVESCSSEAELLQKRELFYRAYFVVVTTTRGQQTQTEWLAHSPPEFLQDMHKMYRILFSMKEKLPPLPNFGHAHPALKK